MGSGQTGKCFEELGRPIIYSVDWKMHHIEMHFSCSQSPSTSPFPPPQPLLFVKYKHKYINNEHSSEMHLLIPDDPNSLPPYLPPLSHSVPAIYQSWKKRAWSAFAELFFIAFFFFFFFDYIVRNAINFISGVTRVTFVWSVLNYEPIQNEIWKRYCVPISWIPDL